MENRDFKRDEAKVLNRPVEVYVLPIGASAEDWYEATSSPVIIHVVNEEQDVDYYHAYGANEAVRLVVPAEGEYQVSFISPVTADGSIYRVPDAQAVTSVVTEAGDGGETGFDGELPFTFEPVAADDVTADELNSIMEQVTEAIKKGDETLTGEAGISVVDTVKENSTANRMYVATYEYTVNGRVRTKAVTSTSLKPPTTIALYYVSNPNRVFSEYDVGKNPLKLLLFVVPVLIAYVVMTAMGFQP